STSVASLTTTSRKWSLLIFGSSAAERLARSSVNVLGPVMNGFHGNALGSAEIFVHQTTFAAPQGGFIPMQIVSSPLPRELRGAIVVMSCALTMFGGKPVKRWPTTFGM